MRHVCVPPDEVAFDPAGRVRAFRHALGLFAPDGSTISLKADPIERQALLEHGDPYFIPAYVGDKGWLGIRLDAAGTDWDEISELVTTSYCLIAPKRLAQQVGSPPSLKW